MIKTLSELDRVRDECRSMVTKRSMMSAGAAAVPLPGVDVAVDIGLLTSMLPDISRRFGLDHDAVAKLDPQIAQKLLVVATSLGNNLIGKYVTREVVVALMKRVGVRVATKSVGKYIPVIGSVISAGISFGAMKLVGNNHIDDCYQTLKRVLEDDSGEAKPIAT